MLVNCPSCQEQIEIPRSTGSQPPKVPVRATLPPIPPPIPAIPPPIPPQETEAKAYSHHPQPVDSTTSSSKPQAGRDFRWELIDGLFMRVRKFLPLATLNGDKVSGVLPTGLCGFIYAELPNPDVEPEQRVLAIPIQNKSDYKSISNAHLDRGVKSGANELIILYEHRRGLFGGRKPCIHVAGYPAGTWQTFFDAVDKYASAEFRWPPPHFVYAPTAWRVFPPTKGTNQNSFRP